LYLVKNTNHHNDGFAELGPPLPEMELERVLASVYDHFENVLFANQSIHHKHYPSIEFEDLVKVFDLFFDATAYDSHKLSCLMNFMISNTARIEHFEASKFIDTLNAFYCNVPYHSYIHACDVTQACFLILNCYEIKYKFTELDRLSLLIAAFGHDACHNGAINNSLKRCFSPLSLVYNDQSPLENLHCFTTLSCLSRSNVNFFQRQITDDQRIQMRVMITESILSTDMAKHYYYLDRISKTKLLKNDNTLLGIALIKASDICNVFREFHCSKKWAEKLFKERGMDRKNIANSQVDFFNNIGLPFFEAIAGSFNSLELFSHSIINNLEQWNKEKA